MIAELREIEAAALADAAAERPDERRDFLRREHAVEPRALDVQDLALEREDRLKVPVAALLRAAAGALPLDDVDLALRRILALAVGELAGERGRIEHAFADDLARLAGRFTRLCRHDGLLEDLPRHLRMLLEVATELRADDVLDDALHLARDELRLRLRVE